MNKMEGADFMIAVPGLGAETYVPMRKSRDLSRRSPASKALYASTRRVLEKPSVRFLASGDVAILNGIDIETMTKADGSTPTQRAMYSSAWAAATGAWEVVNASFTALPPASGQGHLNAPA